MNRMLSQTCDFAAEIARLRNEIRQRVENARENAVNGCFAVRWERGYRIVTRSPDNGLWRVTAFSRMGEPTGHFYCGTWEEAANEATQGRVEFVADIPVAA